ncbi:hypothetical protein [Marinobacter sp. CA1]|uniref:hypothetical protein n=1 Tax=Marinobacter sp. CA1 TaxID=2817656 RepID=UPI001D069044|nr:hypothetical protein [Marinobacter sp. CA1]UDL06167.1 hypothetical protein J2887_05250 [Marinobacter sp. CA1]
MRYSGVCLLFLILSGCGGSSDSQNNNELVQGDSYELVYIDDGAVQCESDGLPAEDSAQRMINKGIDVIESQCARLTGVMFPSECGGVDGGIHVHTIHSENLPDAQKLGFESVSTLPEHEGDSGYAVVECAGK